MIGFYTISKRNVEIYKLIYKDLLVIKSGYKKYDPTLKTLRVSIVWIFMYFQHFCDIWSVYNEYMLLYR